MTENYNVEELYEDFEGTLRKLDELVAQLELWCDEYTINHKKEMVRLEQYVELEFNLAELKEEINAFIAERTEEEGETERLKAYRARVDAKLVEYVPTEAIIHEWMKAILDMRLTVAKSLILQKHSDFIYNIINE